MKLPFREFFSTGKQPAPDAYAVEVGSQQSMPEGFSFLYKAPKDYLELYRELFDNVPILESAVDVYVQLVNSGWKVEGPDGEVITQILDAAGFNRRLNDSLQSTFIYGFSGMETVLSEDMKGIIRFVNIPSEKMRIKVDPHGIILGYYQMGAVPQQNMGGYAPIMGKSSNPDKQGGNVTGPSPMIQLNPATFILLNRMEKDGDVYGRSLFKTMPFITKIMLEVQDNTGKIFKKYGSPRFHVNYIPKVELTQDKLTERLNAIKAKFDDPKTGQDFFSAGDVRVDVIGAAGQKMAFSIETSEVMQAVFSGLKLPAGMLGYNYGSTETHLSGQIQVLMARLYNYQKHYEEMINTQLMPLVAQVYNLKELPKFKFNVPSMEDDAAEAQRKAIEINNALTLLNSGMILPEQAQQMLELPINPAIYQQIQAQRRGSWPEEGEG